MRFPVYGPFQIRKSYFLRKSISILFLFALLTICAAAFFRTALSMTQDLAAMAALYRTGTRCDEVKVSGTIEYTDFIGRRCKLNTEYGVDGRIYSIKTELFRLFGGPGLDDKALVYYSADNPNNAVLSWAYDARYQTWILTIFIFALSLIMAAGALITVKAGFSEIAKVRRLAAKGRIESAEVAGISARSQNKMSTPSRRKTVSVTLSLRFSDGTSANVSYEKRRDTPWFINNDSEVAVLKYNNEWHMLRREGYPLLIKI